MFLVLSAVLATVVAFIRPAPKNSDAIERWFWTHKRYDDTRYDVVAFGDSRIYRGFATPVADSIMRTASLNYGFSSACATPEVLQSLDRRINDGGTVILGITPFVIFEWENSNNQFASLNRLSRVSVLRRRYLDRHFWRLSDPITPKDFQQLTTGRKYGITEEFYPSGYCASTSAHPDSGRVVSIFLDRFREDTSIINHLPDLLHQIDQWLQRGIEVYAVRPPISHGRAVIEDTIGPYDVLEVRKALTRSGAIWIDLPRTGYMTYDGSHLDASAAELWTRQLTDSIIALHPKKRRR